MSVCLAMHHPAASLLRAVAACPVGPPLFFDFLVRASICFFMFALKYYSCSPRPCTSRLATCTPLWHPVSPTALRLDMLHCQCIQMHNLSTALFNQAAMHLRSIRRIQTKIYSKTSRLDRLPPRSSTIARNPPLSAP